MSANSFFPFSTSFRSRRLMHALVHPRVYRRSICVSIERRRETFSIKRRIMKFSTEMPYHRLASASLRRNDDWFSFFYTYFDIRIIQLSYAYPLSACSLFVSLSLVNIVASFAFSLNIFALVFAFPMFRKSISITHRLRFLIVLFYRNQKISKVLLKFL